MHIRSYLYIVPIFLCFAAVSAQAATYYVATTGDDAGNDCAEARSPLTPKKTLWGAVQCIMGGDRVEMRGGTYTGNGFSFGNGRIIPSGTSWTDITTISAYAGETVLLRPSKELPASGYFICGFGFNAQQYNGGIPDKYIAIKNFAVDAINCGDSGGAFYFYGGQTVTSKGETEAQHILLENLEIMNSGQAGIEGGGDDMRFINLDLHHNGSHNNCSPSTADCQTGNPANHGIYWWGHNSLFDGLKIHENYGQGLQFNNSNSDKSVDNNIVRNSRMYRNGLNAYGSGMSVDGNNNLIYNNILYNNPQSGIAIGYSPGSNNNKVYNNTVYGNVGTGISLGDFNNANNTVIKNNIISNNGAPGIDVGTTNSYVRAAGTVIQNNLVYNNNGGDIVVRSWASNTTQSGNITGSNPNFVNAASGDFHLQSNSPAINAGANLSGEGIASDFESTSRPQGSAYDIGADEYGSGTTNPTPTPSPSPTASVSAAPCTNPTPIPSGFSSPCPVFSVSPQSGSLSQNFSVTLTPDASMTIWIYKTLYITEGSTWKSVTLPGTIQYTYWLQGNVTFNFQPSTLNLTPGTHFLASWDWTWDLNAQCYKGPGATACGGGQYRIQTITVQ